LADSRPPVPSASFLTRDTEEVVGCLELPVADDVHVTAELERSHASVPFVVEAWPDLCGLLSRRRNATAYTGGARIDSQPRRVIQMLRKLTAGLIASAALVVGVGAGTALAGGQTHTKAAVSLSRAHVSKDRHGRDTHESRPDSHRDR
jgi:hypothetical protein